MMKSTENNVNTEVLRYSFGANWQSFVDSALNTQRIGKAAKSLQHMLKTEHLIGRTFLDIGCGSGLFSLAACLLGAKKVVAFDYDLQSVQASMVVRARAGISAERWHICQGSVLDGKFLDGIEPVDIVYSWGVLHHTGAMWQAFDKAVSKIKPGGQLAIAIYNDVERTIGGSAMWWQIKRMYNLSPQTVKRLMEVGYAGAFFLKDMLNFRNPLKTVRSYSSDSGRGMDFWHDARDWLGGFPYEYASITDVNEYLDHKFGLQLEYLQPNTGVGCNEFTFRLPNAT
jgi:2-polyprenyl-3-methyl-5-hydroxy-6-metoxy-1,4-benzoquinol methylase